MRFFTSAILLTMLVSFAAANPLEKRCSNNGASCSQPKDCCPGLSCGLGYKREEDIPSGTCWDGGSSV
ncbi:hypothetical protein PILCRDRAFT_824869 [Piloderma croceum F 1598]|uniref:Uncharacterized protein n=1 Tax=Piloderma croceum (strain F 1598) TaxID=765440 RepID=A0A0C3AV80_PILCF|nr:hypothetical protein PILCRDRAFT_824869 [Piloderma croceum F 1598]